MLNGAIQTEFRRRDPAVVARVFPDMARRWSQQRWLAVWNRYARDSVGKLTADLTPPVRLKHSHLREYIAASVVVHCLDGWAYLGRCASAQLVGDQHSASHLGYYAELRGAMAILAAHGVGVFDKEHAVVTATGECVRVAWPRNRSGRPTGPGTHGFVWDALDEWAASPDAADSVLACIRAGGHPLCDWLDHFARTPAWAQTLASSWLRAWGVDIKRLADDRDARNLSSYRPTGLLARRSTPVMNSVLHVAELWRVCEPTPDSPFADLDRELTRAALHQSFKGAYGRSHLSRLPQFRNRVKALVTRMNPSLPPGTDWETYLSSGVPKAGVLSAAKGNDGPESGQHSLQVGARALLLLRLATGASEKLIAGLPQTTRQHLRSLLDGYGADRALWRTAQMPAGFGDLWADIREASEQLASDVANIGCYADLQQRQAPAMVALSSWERAALWGLGV